MLAKQALKSLFIGASFLSAALLFLVEPMAGKMLLPLFGGSPAVWVTCMVFFQAALLAGYAWAHWSLRLLGLRRQPWLQVALVLAPLATLPLALPAFAAAGTAGSAGAQPVLQVLAIVAALVGLPFFVLSTSGPLLQRWFSATSHPQAANPYFLYAAGNLGSFVALLSYPFVVEPTLSLQQQSRWWTAGYYCYVLLIAACAVIRRRFSAPAQALPAAQSTARPIPWPRRLTWVGLAFLPSSLMLGVTTHITTDVAAVPLLWIIPLSLYLLSFVVTFGHPHPERIAGRLRPYMAAGLFGTVVFATLALAWLPAFEAVFYLALFTVIAFVSHGLLSAGRPVPGRLTEFYLWVAVGGVLGGIFNSLIAPLIFNDVYELGVVLLLTLPLLVPLRKLWRAQSLNILLALIPYLLYGVILAFYLRVPASPGSPLPVVVILAMAAMYGLYRRRPIAYGIGMLPLLIMPTVTLAAQSNLFVQRTFFGVIKIHDAGDKRVLVHGVTQHGSQLKSNPATPTTYYSRSGPLGDVISECRERSACARTGVVGLGAGTMAAYGRPGDTLTFYEIDPAIAHVATDPSLFTYISRSPARVSTVIGDGRIDLARSGETYDLLAIDAFSSDSIPTHLLTREAVSLYVKHLAPHGLLAIHITNKQLNLEPVLRAAAADQHLQARVRHDSQPDTAAGAFASRWVVMARTTDDLGGLAQNPGWRPLRGRGVRVWTDNYSNIVDTLF